jgi:hypothetical protein
MNLKILVMKAPSKKSNSAWPVWCDRNWLETSCVTNFKNTSLKVVFWSRGRSAQLQFLYAENQLKYCTKRWFPSLKWNTSREIAELLLVSIIIRKCGGRIACRNRELISSSRKNWLRLMKIIKTKLSSSDILSIWYSRRCPLSNTWVQTLCCWVSFILLSTRTL